MSREQKVLTRITHLREGDIIKLPGYFQERFIVEDKQRYSILWTKYKLKITRKSGLIRLKLYRPAKSGFRAKKYVAYNPNVKLLKIIEIQN